MHVQLAELLPSVNEETVIEEVTVLLGGLPVGAGLPSVAEACTFVSRLYGGRVAGYRACNTEYHDLRHVHDVFLATARMIHGAVRTGSPVRARCVRLALLAALLHDVGYIQISEDGDGTGSKYTVEHVERGAAFVDRHGSDFGLDREAAADMQAMIRLTDLSMPPERAGFASEEAEFCGRILGAADLVAQMADRAYLEKLLFLYREFKEAGVGDYADEIDLLRKTLGFFAYAEERLAYLLPSMERILVAHFTDRWGIGENLYRIAMANHRTYLKRILDIAADPRRYLRRGGILEKIRREKSG